MSRKFPAREKHVQAAQQNKVAVLCKQRNLRQVLQFAGNFPSQRKSRKSENAAVNRLLGVSQVNKHPAMGHSVVLDTQPRSRVKIPLAVVTRLCHILQQLPYCR